MDYQKNLSSYSSNNNSNSNYTYYGGLESLIRVSDEEDELLMTGLRKGPWTAEEDSKLTSSIATYGKGRWNNLALLAGLKRSGKSCRLRWLNYLRPDLRRGPFTLDEQRSVLELHLRWGTRWSKIAENLPGRTDNEIKNYWRTKVQKLAKQFQCNATSLEFRHVLRHTLIPRLVEQIQAQLKTTKAQIEGPGYECGHGLISGYSSSSTSSGNCCLYEDTPISSAQTSQDQLVIEPSNLCSESNILTDSCEAHISPESGSSAELDGNWEEINDFLWEMTLNDGNNMSFLDQKLD